jgi:antirestriction protein ArdC
MRTNQSANNTKKDQAGDAAIQISPKQNLFETITDKIIAVIEAGEATGSITWAGQGASGAMPRNLKTGNPYSGINVLLLWAEAQANGYTSNFWLTFNQAKEMGGQVRKGQKGTQCVFWGSREIEEEQENGETETRKASFAMAFWLFNLDQIDGIEKPETAPAGNVWDAHAAAEALIKASGARIIEGGTMACYAPAKDEIRMPDRERFQSAENFYAVALHELTHWTGHTSRCARDLKSRFGDEAYAMEELVAELGAAFLSAETGISGQLENHASYIKSWLKALRRDPRAIITAASKASQAARFLIDGPSAVKAAA